MFFPLMLRMSPVTFVIRNANAKAKRNGPRTVMISSASLRTVAATNSLYRFCCCLYCSAASVTNWTYHVSYFTFWSKASYPVCSSVGNGGVTFDGILAAISLARLHRLCCSWTIASKSGGDAAVRLRGAHKPGYVSMAERNHL